MSPTTTLAAYGAALAVVFAGAVGVGQLVGPVGTVSEAPAHDDMTADDMTADDMTADH